MQGYEFDEQGFFGAIEPLRVLLIGRQALIVMGLPVLTGDYDLWLHRDDVEALNAALDDFSLVPSCDAEVARRQGRYVLENDERVDVLIARSVGTVDGNQVAFGDVWARRQRVPIAEGVCVHLPHLDDLIQTKRFAARPKDAEDIRLLETLRGESES